MNLNRHRSSISLCYIYPDSKIHVANMGPAWVLAAPGGPHAEPMNLAIRVACCLTVRLRGGQHYMEGRVEIFVRDRWGTVCDDTYDDSWDDADAKVVCRMLGFGEHGSAARRHTFRHGTGHVWLNGLDCRGDEISLEQCENVRWGGENCGRHDLDAGVRCLPLEH